MTSPAAVLLDEVSSLISRFVVLTPAQADTCALFVLHTHTFAAARFTPYLHITSAQPRSGKSLLLRVLRAVVAKPWLTGRVSAAALVRKIDEQRPTLLLDEVDTVFSIRTEYSETLRGVLNSGFEAAGAYTACDKLAKSWKAHDFRVFSPKVIAGIGQLEHTLQDRTLPIWLQRARRDETREPFRETRLEAELANLKQRCAEWSLTATDALKSLNDPETPVQLNARQGDTCGPLLSIADYARSPWPERSRAALVEICAARRVHDESDVVQLLYHIRDLLDELKAERIASADLVALLNSREEWPWADYDNGRPLTANKLARLLRPLQIGPRDHKFNDQVLKGYRRVDFEDAWLRY